MSEAKEGCALLEDVDERKFVRFSQYAYTGDYIAADPDTLLDSSTIPSPHFAANEAPMRGDGEKPPPPKPSLSYFPHSVTAYPKPDSYEPSVANDDEDWRCFSTSKKDKKRGKQASQSKRSRLWDKFKNTSYAISKPAFQPQKNGGSCEVYTEIFLSHASLYVFADKYDVGPLKDLSLHKLQRTLVDFTLYDQRVGDIIHIIRYSYSNTADHPGLVDNLRVLGVHYLACVVDELSQSVEFQLLLEEFSTLGRDLIKQMVNRLD